MDVFQSLAPFNIHLLRMLKGAHDVFNIVVSNNWEPKHVYNELFEAIDAFGVAMVARL
jgi:hypothetical protein